MISAQENRRDRKGCSCISWPFVLLLESQISREKQLCSAPVITPDNELITAHRIGWIIWTCQIIKRMRYQIDEAKSVKYDAQQRVGVSFMS